MSLPSPDDLLAVAHIARPRGLHGEVSALPLAPPVIDPTELIVGRRLFLRDSKGTVSECVGEAVREHKGRWLLLLEGVESEEDAEKLRASDLCLPRGDLPPLPEGWYWEADIQGCRVIDIRLGEIGIAAGLDVQTPQAQLIVARPGGATARIPWVKGLIPRVEIENREIHTDLPDGFPGISEEIAEAED